MPLSWLRSNRCSLRILEWVEPSAWQEAERRLIARHRSNGQLLNVADGGNQPKRSDDPVERRLWELKNNLLRGIKHMSPAGRLALGEKLLAAIRRWDEEDLLLTMGNSDAIR